MFVPLLFLMVMNVLVPLKSVVTVYMDETSTREFEIEKEG